MNQCFPCHSVASYTYAAARVLVCACFMDKTKAVDTAAYGVLASEGLWQHLGDCVPRSACLLGRSCLAEWQGSAGGTAPAAPFVDQRVGLETLLSLRCTSFLLYPSLKVRFWE